jgi:hypothetical protein
MMERHGLVDEDRKVLRRAFDAKQWLGESALASLGGASPRRSRRSVWVALIPKSNRNAVRDRVPQKPRLGLD